jgi:hypothetical protein
MPIQILVLVGGNVPNDEIPKVMLVVRVCILQRWKLWKKSFAISALPFTMI